MRIRWLAVVLVLTSLFTLLDVELSRRIGRLLWIADWDDVAYLLEGTRLLDVCHDSGWRACVQSWLQRGFHAPFESLLAALALALGGFRGDAPYYANGLFFTVYLAGLAYFLRRLPLWLGALALLVFATLPFATMIIVEFRPDPIWSVVMGWGAMYALTEPDYALQERKRWIHCFSFALAMWLKPAAFVVTLPLFGFSLVAAWMIAGRPGSGWRSLIGAWARQVALFSVAIAPLLWINGQHMISYFMEHWFGPGKEIWHKFQVPRDRFTYYLVGEGGVSNLGPAGVLPACFLVAALGLRKERRRAIGVAAFLKFCYIIPTVSSIKTVFLAGPMYATFIFACAESLGRVDFQSRRRVVALLSASLVCCALWRFPQGSRRDNPYVTDQFLLQNQAIELIEAAQLPASPRILFAQGGPILPYSVSLALRWRGVRLKMHESSWEREPSGFSQHLEDADLIFIQPPGLKVMGFEYSWLPADAFLEGHRKLIEANPNFEPYATLYNRVDGQPIELYRRKPGAPRRDVSPIW